MMWNFDYEHKWIVPKEGRGGGLALLWKSSINVSVEDSSKYFIDTIIDKNTDNAWRFTGFYGEPITSIHCDAWDALRRLNHSLDSPWLCVGDFNEIVRQEEKLGGAIRHHNQMQLFWDIIYECGFMDLRFTGSQITWSKHFEDGHSIWERLGRGLVNNNWFLKFSGSRVHHLHCSSSDHSPLLINLSGLDQVPRKKNFRFEEMWLANNRCAETIEASWQSSLYQFSDNAVLKKVEKCGKELTWWDLNVFGNVRKELEEKNKLLIQAEREATISRSNWRVRGLKSEINILLDKEARKWC